MAFLMWPSVWVAVLGNAEPIFPQVYPTFYSIPLAQKEIALFDEQFFRSETGIGMSGASKY